MTQLKLQTKYSIAPVLKASKQSGFAILMALLVLVLGAAAWYGSIGGKKSESMKTDVQSEHMAGLQHVKERMLAYAALNPEIFDEVGTSTPGPGYFPCPDTEGKDQSSTGWKCSASYMNSMFTIGWVPQKIDKRNFSFLSSGQKSENRRYWFAVDTRFLVDGNKYRYGSVSNRFAPLNINTPSLVDASLSSPIKDPNDPRYCNQTPASNNAAGCVSPLTLDGKGDIVMVLFYAGEPLGTAQDERKMNFREMASGQIIKYLEQPSTNIYNGKGPGNFISKGNGVEPFNDYVIAITREEWNAAMLNRVAKDENGNSIPDLCEIPLDIYSNTKTSWFDDCRYSGSAPPYPCTNIATLSTLKEGVSDPGSTMMASSVEPFEFSGFSVDWGNWLGLNQLWRMIGDDLEGLEAFIIDIGIIDDGGGGGGGGGGTPVENIEGQGWRTVLECP